MMASLSPNAETSRQPPPPHPAEHPVVVAPEWDEVFGVYRDQSSTTSNESPENADVPLALSAQLAIAWRGGKCGLIDMEGNIRCPFEWDDMRVFEDVALARVRRDGKIGWIDLQGEVVIPVEWDQISYPPEDGDVTKISYYRWVANEGKWRGWTPGQLSGNTLNREEPHGRWGQAADDRYLSDNFNSDGLICLVKEGSMRVFDVEGNVKMSIDGRFGLFDSIGLAWVDYGEDDGMYETIDGWMDRDGKDVIRLPGEGWRDVVGDYGDLAAQYRESGFYLATKRADLGPARNLLLTVDHWMRGEFDTDFMFVSHCYDLDGKLIWSSTWVRYESVCWMVFWVALMVAFFARPRFLHIGTLVGGLRSKT